MQTTVSNASSKFETRVILSLSGLVDVGTAGPCFAHVPGRHNALNATAAVAIAHQLEVTSDKIIEGLKSFRGVDRRFQVRGQAHGVTVVDDYGHHPTEIRATLAAAQLWMWAHSRRLSAHRYTRTRDLLERGSVHRC